MTSVGSSWLRGGRLCAAERAEELDLPFAAPCRVAVELPAGEAVVRTSAEGPWRAVCRFRAEAPSDEDAERALGQMRFVVEPKPGRITAGPAPGARELRGIDVSTCLEVCIPPGIDVAVSAGVGHVVVHGSFARLDVDLAAGQAELAQVECTADGLHVHVGSGRVEVRDAAVDKGTAIVRVGGGDVLFSGRARTVTLCTGAGNVEAVCDEDCHEVRCESGAGHIEAELRAVPAGMTHLATHAGDVIVRMPSQAGATMVLSTHAGGIDAEEPLGITVAECRESAAGARVECRSGGGGPHVTVATEAGDIALRVLASLSG